MDSCFCLGQVVCRDNSKVIKFASQIILDGPRPPNERQDIGLDNILVLLLINYITL